MNDYVEQCFLCDPDASLVFARGRVFYAMLGHGPIREGYSIIATTLHKRSMLDLSASEQSELLTFQERVQSILRPKFGPTVITEHGRVPVCTQTTSGGHEQHCLHAHRLVFTGFKSLQNIRHLPGVQWTEMERDSPGDPTSGHYLYYEDDDGHVEIGVPTGAIPRQLFRNLAALQAGSPELADWRTHKGQETIDAALRMLEIAE